MNTKKTTIRKVRRYVVAALALAVIYSIGWFWWSRTTYDKYSKGLEPLPANGVLVPRYDRMDNDGYDYFVKYPDPLTFTGNLCVGTPSEGDNPFTDALIIWPKAGGGYEYGALLYEDNTEYQIYINCDGTPRDAGDAEAAAVIERHADTIQTLLQKARSQWGLE